MDTSKHRKTLQGILCKEAVMLMGGLPPRFPGNISLLSSYLKAICFNFLKNDFASFYLLERHIFQKDGEAIALCSEKFYSKEIHFLVTLLGQ